MASTSIARARVATLAGPGDASRLWPKGRFARAWVPAYDPYESDDLISPPLSRPTLPKAVSSVSVRANAHESSAKQTETMPSMRMGLSVERFQGSFFQSTPISGLPLFIQRTWAPAPRAESPKEDYTYEDAFSPMEVALARISEASYFPSDTDAAQPRTATSITVRAHPPSPVVPMSITRGLARRPGLQRMPTFVSPRVLTVATFVPEMCTPCSREREHGARFALGFGFLFSPRAPRASTPQPVPSFPTAIAREEGLYMLDDSPFTPTVEIIERSPAQDPVDLFAYDFATSPGPSMLLGPLPPSDPVECSTVSPSDLELRDFPLTPSTLGSASSGSGELLRRPDSPVDAFLNGDYMFGVYL